MSYPDIVFTAPPTVQQSDEIKHAASKRSRDYDLVPEEFSSDEESDSTSDDEARRAFPAEPFEKSRPQEKTSSTETIDTSPPEKMYPLIRQDAKVGDNLIRALGKPVASRMKICGRSLKKRGAKKCQRSVYKYRMCTYHWKKWKTENPWLKYPGHY